MSNETHIIKTWIDNLLLKTGLDTDTVSVLDGWVIFIFIIIIALLTNVFLRWVVMRSIHWVVLHTKASWDDFLFDDKVVQRLCGIVTPVMVSMLLPMLGMAMDEEYRWLGEILTRAVDVYLVVMVVLFINALLKASFHIMECRPGWQGKPIKGLRQTGQVVLACIAVILIIAILIDKSPAILLTGLGASAAVLMLVFQDSLLGLVAGVQLSANNMLKVGDWITMTQRGIDGVVEEVALTTIKIRGWDNTLQTLPPHLLVSEPFDNWQAMRDAGGRRIKRSLNIDMTSVRFFDEERIAALVTEPVVEPLLRNVATSIDDARMITNLELYIRVITQYIDRHPRINHTMTVMVRQLQPTEWGLPIELYCFSENVNWVPYEQLQTEIISYVVALAPYFGLRLYQAPSSHDLKG
ncbi:MAG: mechanosensitive ion channel [Alistipes sp.]|nr:mechanosensitive ion channel [Alistipes sp.]